MKKLLKGLFSAAVRLLYAVSVFFIPVISIMLIWQKEHPEGIFMTPFNVKALVIQLVIYSLIFMILTIRFIIMKKKANKKGEHPWNTQE